MSYKKLMFALGGFLLYFMLSGLKAFACECSISDKNRPVPDAFNRAVMVITAKMFNALDPTVLTIENDGKTLFYSDQSFEMKVEKVYKGDVKKGDILTFGYGTRQSCIIPFNKNDVGKTFLFYLDKPTKGFPYRRNDIIEKSNIQPKYYASTCGRSAEIEKAAEYILILNSLLSKKSN